MRQVASALFLAHGLSRDVILQRRGCPQDAPPKRVESF
jgi:hypothetical protein